MAILGGAGNPIGGSFTGPAEALELVSDRCYAYSGLVNDASSGSAATTLVKFTTGNFVSVVECFVFTDSGGNTDRYFSVTMNGTIVYQGQYDDVPAKVEGGGPWAAFVIPSYTEFEIKWGATASRNCTLSLVGRVYR